MKRARWFHMLVVMAVCFLQCSCGGQGKNAKIDVSVADEDLITTALGLRWKDLKIGTGKAVQKGDVVQTQSTVWLKDGKLIEHFGGRIVFTVGSGEAIRGEDEGVVGMKVGGKRKLIVPPELGFGNRRYYVIPPNSELTIELELLRCSGD